MKLNFVFKPVVVITAILILAFAVRLYKIDNPIADWHSWRQADTAAVSRIFYQEGFNPLSPKYQDMSGVAENPIPNPNRYRFVEFPIYNSLVYFGYLLVGGVDERVARLISILFSLGSIVFVFLIAKKYFGLLTGFLSALLMAILPYNVYFSRVILPEPMLVFLCLGMFYFLVKAVNFGHKSDFVVGSVFTALAFLLKPMAILYLLPVGLIYIQKVLNRGFSRKHLWFVLSFLPLFIWRIIISAHPEGIPASNWLFNGNHIRFKPAFWYWILSDRLGREILSVCGSVLFFIGLLIKPFIKNGLMMHALAASAILYIIVFATGNVQHDYYQYLITPVLIIFVARGAAILLSGQSFFIPRLFTIPVAILFLVLTIYFGWMQVSGLYQINNPIIVEAGKQADKILPKNAVVLAPYNGDTAFLYYINRPGFPVESFPISNLVEKYGVTHLVSVARDAKTAWMIKNFTVLTESEKYYIVDLTKPKPGFDPKLDPEP